MGGKLFVAEMFSWKSSILNLHFYSQICGKYNHGASFVFNNGGSCLQNSLSVRWHGFYLLLGLCVSWLVVTGVGFVFGSWVRFGSGFVSWGLYLVLGLSVCGLVSM